MSDYGHPAGLSCSQCTSTRNLKDLFILTSYRKVLMLFRFFSEITKLALSSQSPKPIFEFSSKESSILFILWANTRPCREGVRFLMTIFHFRNSETSLVCLKKDNHLTHEMLMSKMSEAVFTVRRRLVREPIPVTSRVRWQAPAFCLRHVCFIALTFVYSPSNYFWLLVDKDKWGD